MPQFPLSASRHADFQTRNPAFFWPPNITALERIALSSPGDLRQSLSEYLDDIVQIHVVWDTPRQIGGRTIHTRVMNLSHQHRIICTSLATIRIAPDSTYVISTGPKSAASPLPFETNPKFTLLAAGIEKRLAGGKVQDALWRRYSLTAPGVDCEVEESFADRNIFANPAAAQYWVNKHMPDVISKLHPSPMPSPRMKSLVV
ncbi:hypothetical protein RSOLAG1IB_00478 [Rhizoctonia solani AG-1 IB]|uniref:Uncharacterized protein n=1 Tax=Thanatephorus cucumeris (strain AG1-IB / isolate 7/3/14) TaxID=1108050 RepID=M5BP67_THACB|nr:hypothetical protein BN14_02097 [Rhizoctonia solani AG-1 IB]CEL51941.1 hypothetical protein RSOLAG1IB_00478 [Rhizoctonia solani AG-1 IB]